MATTVIIPKGFIQLTASRNGNPLYVRAADIRTVIADGDGHAHVNVGTPYVLTVVESPADVLKLIGAVS